MSYNLKDTVTIKGIDKPVLRIALGTWAIGGWMWGGPDDDNAIKTIHKAIDNGINVIDTAPVYGFGHSEEVVGKALQGKRDKIVIATKVALNWTDDKEKVFRDTRPERIRQEIEDSLKRLKTDYIDLYQIHWPDDKTPIEQTAIELNKLHKEGKIKAIGVSNFSVQQMEAIRQYTDLASIQPPYNLFEREIEKDILPYAKKHDLAALCYGPLCRGLLSGKMTRDRVFNGDDLRKSDPKFSAANFENYLAATEELKTFAKDNYNKSLLALAIRWVLDQYQGNIPLWGARKPEQIEGIQDALGWSLSEQDLKTIDDILNKHIKEPISPEFMAPPSR
ncbi:Pyridoxal reductase PdxI or related oxidoreductase [Commensalibacter communis]|uniref:aldo/keto reductase n=1 Tax=Commensalibacter communis TaxID=2972786 RepID=UPI0022FF5BF9|nr:aldo/keto reductase [Commensalibacter communis]CAI3951334.1 Pyridoxal reductase PdxI or related oxidoreductase [Commensalibacter communis]CAI3953064.1 Pyridoxal reductase PdxI or related oxidoreductase [Commensalibacter communis]